MNLKKLKIIYFPQKKLIIFSFVFLAVLFFQINQAKAVATCSWLYPESGGLFANKTCAGLQLGDKIDPPNADCANVTKPSACDWPTTIENNPCLCCCKTTAPTINDTMPKWTNPLDNLQVKIPGLIFTKSNEIKCEEQNGKKICNFPWIGEYIAGIYKYAIGIVGILAAVVLMIGGVIWIMAGGSATMIGEAKAWIGASLTGLVIALCSYVILYQVNPALVGFSGLNVQIVDIKPEEIVYTGGGGEMGTSVIPTDPAVRDKYDAFLKNAGYDCTTSKAIMFAESSGNPNATSPAGAQGLMQLMPSTAQSLGISGNLYDPQTNINAGEKYLTKLSYTACNGSSSNSLCNTSDIKYIIAAYNGGLLANKESTTCPGKTYWECENNSGYAQTRKYVSMVLANIQNLKDNGGACQ